MKWLWKVIKWLLWLILAVVVLFLLNLAYFRWRGPTEAQKAALERVEAGTPRPQGRNGFALMWLFDKDIADGEMERAAEQDVKFAQENAHAGNELGEFPSSGLPTLPEPAAGSKVLCQAQETDCLALVRTNREATRSELAAHPRLLARAIQLEEFDYLRNDFPKLATMPIAYDANAQRLRLSSLALAYVDGQREEALAGTCHNLATWRRFGRGNPSLIYSMIAVAQRDASLRLIAQMLAGLEADDSVPQQCESALADVAADEISLCAPMMGEFAYTDVSLARMLRSGTNDSADEVGLGGKAESLFLSESQYRAWRAEKAESFCGSKVDEAALQDRLPDRSNEKIGRLECASNWVGCILADIAAPAFVDYEARLLDAAAHLRLAATLVWLRNDRDDARPLATRFAERPPSLRSGTRASGISDDGRSLWVENFNQQRDKRFELMLVANTETLR
jgi:hypothetical protein